MLVRVSQPHINDFTIKGTLSKSFLDNIKKEFGKDLVIEEQDEDEGWVNFEDTDLFKDFKNEETAGKNLRFYRKLNKLTQPQLAEKLGTSKQAISQMENDKRPISGKTAKQLAKILNTSVTRFLF